MFDSETVKQISQELNDHYMSVMEKMKGKFI